ncbi:hypothetical protein BEL04_11250 [Mucilaginibacter sp. PPCGB 2223]|uniref:hypothetical protein n=1 Tax=Mucilaginibacter sp. PPCGB 2223 TaxID=1886027 RepID=UPI000824D2BA|nr:hypothetical protein [Mucilaginibacter sp. PPCGB 2223]OCX52073.1 hypothetical protein BEL04_11250 [Mucilaginibacter sp. PPCGB 2223]
MKTLIAILSAALLLNACKSSVNNTTQVAADTALNDTIISVNVAKRLINNFGPRSLKKDKNWADTRSVWFPIGRLKKLIDTIEKDGGDGIRFYFAAYDKTKMNDIHIDSTYWDHATLVMVSTTKLRTTNGGPKVHLDNTEPAKKGHVFTFKASPENQGEMCPPPSNCDVVGATLVDSNIK